MHEYPISHCYFRRHLPVTKLNFGGANGRAGKLARFELGPVYCSGSSASAAAGSRWKEGPENCRDLWRNGITQAGYYLVKPASRSAKYPKIVFCDLAAHEDDPGFERIYGEPGNLRNFAAFDVSISKSFYDDYRYVNFSSASVNTDGAFDLRDGIYRAPFSGTYLFSVHGLPVGGGRPFRLQIHRNGASVAAVTNGNNGGDSMAGQSILLELAAGDEMRLFNFGGDIYDDPTTADSFLHFVGVLVYSKD